MRVWMTCRAAIFCFICFCAVARPVSAAPGQARLIAPSGEVTGSTIAFTWQSVPDSTWYQLWLGRSTTGVLLEQWYTAGQAGCASGGTCVVNITVSFPPGSYDWYVQTWDATGAGPWSVRGIFALKELTRSWSRKLPDAQRFTLVLDDAAVLDNETGLTWQRTPSVAATFENIVTRCSIMSAGGRMGWRAPALAELLTLAEPGRTPTLPAGHPFQLGSDEPSFWTITNSLVEPSTANSVNMSFGPGVFGHPKNVTHRGWCVRGSGADRLQ